MKTLKAIPTVLVLGFGAYSGIRLLVTANEPREVITVQQTKTIAWYSGGTLHQASIEQWNAADERDRIATAADLATVLSNEAFASKEALKPKALDLAACISKRGVPKWAHQRPVSEIAASCASQLSR